MHLSGVIAGAIDKVGDVAAAKKSAGAPEKAFESSVEGARRLERGNPQAEPSGRPVTAEVSAPPPFGALDAGGIIDDSRPIALNASATRDADTVASTGAEVEFSDNPPQTTFPNIQRRDDLQQRRDQLQDLIGNSTFSPEIRASFEAELATVESDLATVEGDLLANAERGQALLDDLAEEDFLVSRLSLDRSSEIGSLRQQIVNDPAVLEGLAATMDEQDYLDMLVELRANQGGGSFPYGAPESDDLIRGALPADYLDGPISRGARADGNLAIVDDESFEAAFQAHPGFPSTNFPDISRLNGFVDDQGRQWVRASSANAGTPIHEALHFYSDDAVINISAPLNEGITDYFTHEVLGTEPGGAAILASRDAIYKDNRDFTTDLVGLVGEDAVAEAYFDGDVDGLRDAYLSATGRPESDWNDMIAAISARGSEDWATANALLTPLPTVPSTIF